MKTPLFQGASLEHSWQLIDCSEQALGRVANRIAILLRGKHKPTFTPHADTGDFVVAVNAAKLRLTGQKLTQKMYYHHSGYFGGLRKRTAKEVMAKTPEEVLRHAVKGMLPRSTLGRQLLGKLKIYATAEHPHAAQLGTPAAA
ncbi:MAG: 50S ribosomal protein L13 [Deltaproteobacteria bacterium]|nr:50S ribosomal protein L13 [Deltaproteobacteria bacterium]